MSRQRWSAASCAATFAVLLALTPLATACGQSAAKPADPKKPESTATMEGDEMANPRVALETTKGRIVLELDQAAAPKTVANFLGYVESGFYDGTVFHRIIPKFMIQGGGFTADMDQKSTGDPIENEADNGLRNARGTIAMARTQNPHSATAQFFINTVDNEPLDHTGKDLRGWGYAVFGKVVDGMDVVDAIEGVATGNSGPHQNVPVDPVVIEKAGILQ